MLSKSQIKYIQSLGHKKSRDENNVFIAEGPKIVSDLIRQKNVVIKDIYAVTEWLKENMNSMSHGGYTEISEDELKRISQQNTPNQVLCIVQKMKWDKEPEFKNKIVLVLDTIQDPGNLGTIIRIADWFGIEQIFCSNDSADIYNPKVIQSSMGSISRVRVDYVDLNELLGKQDHIRTYAAVLDGKEVNKMDKIKEGIIIIGNESKGINKQILDQVDVRVTIPGKGNTESLNAAVATGIILSHLI